MVLHEIANLDPSGFRGSIPREGVFYKSYSFKIDKFIRVFLVLFLEVLASDNSEIFNMRIDENGNLEIECDEDFKQGIVNDYDFTFNPNQIIYTKDLRHCVGLAFIDEVSGTRKRGLMHVLYNKEFVKSDKGYLLVPKDRALRTKAVLDNFLKDFEKSEDKKRVFKNPRAIMVYNRTTRLDTKTEKITLRDEFTNELHQKEIEDRNRYENPMADFIKHWLEKKYIDLYAPNATSNKKLPSVLNMEEDPKEICYKQFSLGHDRIRIGMYNRQGILLNKNDYEAWLDF